jgi:DNA-binding protein H-NS
MKAFGMSKINELIAARVELEKRIYEIQRDARALNIAKVRAVMAEFGVTAADIKGKATAGRASGAEKPRGKLAIKYRNKATGDTWAGRGRPPRWLTAALASGAKLADFAV